jgi:hypothetical protein
LIVYFYSSESFAVEAFTENITPNTAYLNPLAVYGVDGV